MTIGLVSDVSRELVMKEKETGKVIYKRKGGEDLFKKSLRTIGLRNIE